TAPSQTSFRFLAGYERQVPEVMVDVEPVAVDEGVVDGEAEVVDGYLDLAPRWLRQQRGNFHAGGVAALEVAEQVLHGEAGINDVLDQDDVLACQAQVQVLDEPDLAAGLGVRAVARHRQEVEGERHVD